MATVSLQELERIVAGLSRAEKAQVLQWVARDLGDAFPGVDTTPDILGGEARIVRTRISVWTLVQMRQLGLSDASILASYPTLRAEDLASAWAYARLHPSEIERDIAENEMA